MSSRVLGFAPEWGSGSGVGDGRGLVKVSTLLTPEAYEASECARTQGWWNYSCAVVVTCVRETRRPRSNDTQNYRCYQRRVSFLRFCRMEEQL